MVGFPGETQEQFEETMSLFKEVQFTNAYMFAYSPRTGTGAAKYTDQVDDKEKKLRLNQLIDYQTGVTKEHYASMVGKDVEIFLTLEQKNGRGWVGQDYGAKRVVLETSENVGGKIIKAKVVKHSGMTLIVEEK
jgi:tRNA-2-methylthio-N6-dimethylallyladenosine synthase